MKQLQISKTLSLPADAITQALAFIGRRGSGKSYAATKLAELLASIGAQFIAIDPVGIWYSLRLAKDGKNKGLDIVIFGGLNGDLPIESTGGTLIADIIADRNISAVIDVSQFESDADKTRFARDFASRFFFRKKASPSAVHIFLEEAQEFIPQNIQRGEEKMLHDWQRMIRLGRNYGIGVSMISQRPQDINKKALNQAECVFAFQLTGTHEREAVKAWISDKGLKEDLFHTLTTLETGHAHVWSPAWLRISEEIMIAPKETFAAGSTPKLGDKPITVKALAPIELEKLKEDMKATIEKIKADDPKELKKALTEKTQKIQQLEKQLAAKPAAKFDQGMITERIQDAVLNAEFKVKEYYRKEIEKIHAQVKLYDKKFEAFQKDAPDILTVIENFLSIDEDRFEYPKVKNIPSKNKTVITYDNVTTVVSRPVKEKDILTNPQKKSQIDGGLTGPEQRIIDAILWLNTIGIAQPTKQQIAFISGYRIKKVGGNYGNALGSLRTKGLIQYPNTGIAILTEEGRLIANDPGIDKTSNGLQTAIMEHLEGPERKILTNLIEVYPDSLDKIELGARSGYQITKVGGNYGNALGSLRSLGLISYPSTGMARANDLLFID